MKLAAGRWSALFGPKKSSSAFSESGAVGIFLVRKDARHPKWCARALSGGEGVLESREGKEKKISKAYPVDDLLQSRK